jgi:hypothetical protein
MQDAQDFSQGMYADSNPLYQPKSTYIDAENMAIVQNGNVLVLSKHAGIDGAITLTDDPNRLYTVIGTVTIKNKIVLFLHDEYNQHSIGVIENKTSFRHIYTNEALNFSLLSPVWATGKSTVQGDIIYFVDNLNPIRFINIDTVTNATPIDALSLLPNIASPDIEFIDFIDEFGNIPCGTIQFAVRYYLSATQTTTPFVEVSNTIPITPVVSAAKWPNNEGAPVTVISNKSVTMRLSGVSNVFDFIEIAVIKRDITNTIKGEVFARLSTVDATFDFTYTGNESVLQQLTNLDISQVSASYTSAEHIEQKTGRLFLANLGVFAEPSTLQTIANNTILKFKTEQIEAEPQEWVRERTRLDTTMWDHIRQPITPSQLKAYRDPQRTARGMQTYMRGEVYSFALQFKFKNNHKTFAYHIPALDVPNTEAFNIAYSNTQQAFIGNFGTYRSGATYPADNGYPNGSVRHHRMPTQEQIPLFTTNDQGEFASMQLLSILVELPVTSLEWLQIKDHIEAVYLLRQDRDLPTNESIVSQGLLVPMTELQRGNQAFAEAPFFGRVQCIAKSPGFRGDGQLPDYGEYSNQDTDYMYPNVAGQEGNDPRKYYIQSFYSIEQTLEVPTLENIDNIELVDCYTESAVNKTKWPIRKLWTKEKSTNLEKQDYFYDPSTMKKLFNLMYINLNRRGLPKFVTSTKSASVIEARYMPTPYGSVANAQIDAPPITGLLNMSTLPKPIRGLFQARSLVLSLSQDIIEDPEIDKVPFAYPVWGLGTPLVTNMTAGVIQGSPLNTYKWLVNLKRTLLNQYGEVYNATYVKVGKLNLTQPTALLGGDTFINQVSLNMCVGVRIVNGTSGNSDGDLVSACNTIVTVPLESKHNFYYRHRAKDQDTGAMGPDYLPNDIIYTNLHYESSLRNSSPDLTQFGVAKSYNAQYSIKNNLSKAFPKPLGYISQDRLTNTIAYSERSIEGEQMDSYRIMLPNNVADIPRSHGVITNLVNVADTLYAHTQYGLWRTFANDREAIQTDVGGFYVGTGAVFQNSPIMISDTGTNYKFSCLNTPVGYFFVDDTNRTVCHFYEQVKRLSDDGLFTYYRFKFDTPESNHIPYLGNGFITVYDPFTRTVYFTDHQTNECLSYSILTGKWISKHPLFMFGHRANFGTNTYVTSYNKNIIYRMNLGDTYFGISQPASVTFVTNPAPLASKVFDNIASVSSSAPTNIQTRTEDKVSLSTVVNSDNMRKLNNQYQLVVPRDLTDEGRMRGKFMVTKLTFNQLDWLAAVTTTIRQSNR